MVGDEIQPLVTIIITTFNREMWVEKAIQSALDQDYNNIEIIISDNNSTDNSHAIITKYCIDPRIKYRRNEVNIGMLANFRKATSLAQGLFITYVSSDDYLANKSFISEAVAVFKKYNNVVVFSGISKSLYSNSNREEHNPSYKYKVGQGLLNRVIEGKTVFTAFQYSHILNFGGSVFFKDAILNLDVFREPNTTYADLQTILFLALKGDFYLSGKTGYVQTFHTQNASRAYADAERSLLNLSFAEIPFEEAKKLNVFSESELNSWRYNILKPFIIDFMIILFNNNKIEFQKFVNEISKRYPEILPDVWRDKKWRLFKLIYSNKILTRLYDRLKPLVKLLK